MALVPWTYNNPRVNRADLQHQTFTFQGHAVQIFQDTGADIDVTKNTALKLWDGAYLLARHLENADIFPEGFWKGKKCIELGAGCGLVGTVAWLLGADVTLTDLEDSLDHTNKCLVANVKNISAKCDQVHKEHVRTRPYIWGRELIDLAPPYDVILGSDIIYQPSCAKDLVNALVDLSAVNTQIFIAYKPRGLGEDVFFKLLERKQFTVNKIDEKHNPKEFLNSEYSILQISMPK